MLFKGNSFGSPFHLLRFNMTNYLIGQHSGKVIAPVRGLLVQNPDMV